MANLLDLLVRKKEPSISQCVFTSGEHRVKEDRSEAVTYQAIGMTKYAAGIPPTVYNNAITAVRSYPIVYGCITAISEAIAGLNIKVYQNQNGQRVEVQDHPYYQMFSNPNPGQGSFEFLEQVQQSLDVTGNAFISMESIAGSFEFYHMPTKYMAIIPDPKIKVKEYHYYINGLIKIYKPEEIIHIKYSDVDDPYYGMPPLGTATDVLTFEKSRLQFANQFFQNGAIPVGVLETEQNLGEILLKKLRGEWTAIHQGITNSHKVAILQNGLKYRPITSPIKDLDFPALKKLSKDDILTIFKIPESILGSQEGTGSNEGKGAITAFWRQCIIPRVKRIESGLNRGLFLNVMGQGAFSFEFNLKDVVALQDDKKETADYLSTLVGSSIMTPNDARSVIGLPVSKDAYADQLLVTNSFFGNAAIPAADALAQGAGSTTPKPGAKPGGGSVAVGEKPAAAKPGAKPAAKPVAPAAKPAKKPTNVSQKPKA
jgi:HK97 family phage portal protein